MGKFLLTVNDDHSNKTRQLTPRLGRESGEHVRVIEVPREVTDRAEGLELQAGKYVLTEVCHTAWSCSVVIECALEGWGHTGNLMGKASQDEGDYVGRD